MVKGECDWVGLTKSVCDIAVEVGALLRTERKSFRREQVEEKGFHDYVSYVDKESEYRLVTLLHALLPEAGFIAEEGTGDYQAEEYCWVVDPLDGTTNFIHDTAPYCISIALRNRQELLVGVVYEVCRDECYWACKGGKAYLNGEEIHVSDISEMDKASIALGFPYAVQKYKSTAVGLIGELYGYASSLRLQGAAAAELCYIAAGRCEARIEACLGPWDIAAGTLILQQAGGKVTDFSGGTGFITGSEVLASNGLLHEELLAVMQRVGS